MWIILDVLIYLCFHLLSANNNESIVFCFTGVRLLGTSSATDEEEYRALSYKVNITDIYSNSWGPSDRGTVVSGPKLFAKMALKDNTKYVSF